MPSLVLVGMPGSGKSTAGRALARRLGLGFIDTDTRIEQLIGCPIRLFFEREGEAAFRDVEQEVLADLGADDANVIATGGGAVLRPVNRQRLRQLGTVVYLHATPQELYRRLHRDTGRPLLQVADPRERLATLYAERDPLYREVAQLVVDTGRPSIPALVRTVVSQLELAGLLPGR